MARKNWRNMQWSTMGISERFWFIAMALLLLILLIMYVIDRLGIVDIPDWVGVIWMILAAYSVYKNVEGNHMYDDDDDDNDDDPADLPFR